MKEKSRFITKEELAEYLTQYNGKLLEENVGLPSALKIYVLDNNLLIIDTPQYILLQTDKDKYLKELRHIYLLKNGPIDCQ